MSERQSEIGGRNAKYVLVVLVIVYIFNFIDRQILSILAEEIKADLGVSDADMGFLYGTAFAVFYAVFGIPLGKLADVWVRKSLISVGLSFWSLMTALSGTAQSFGGLAVFRFGVGVGEASATPAAYSILSDYFSPRVRATVLALYSSGAYIGIGLGLLIGGLWVDFWKTHYPGDAPFGLQAWQAAFFVVGLPGLLMALWVRTLREPQRGISEGVTQSDDPHPFRAALTELMTVLPPFTIVAAARGRVLAGNLVGMTVVTVITSGLISWLGSPSQWIALGLGVYAAFSWVLVMARRDPPAFALMFRSRAFVLCCVGFSSIGFVGYGIGFWMAPFMLRVHNADLAQAATLLGMGVALGGLIGVTFGGWSSDRLRRRTPHGRLYIGVAAALLSTPVAILFLTTSSIWLAYASSFAFSIFSALFAGAAASTINDLVLPRMRASASAFYILVFTFVGLALGPYSIGQMSDALTASGIDSGEALRQAMLSSLVMFTVTVIALLLASRYLASEEASRLERARAAGELI